MSKHTSEGEPPPGKKAKKPKCAPIVVVPNFGGRRCPAEGPPSVQDWGLWDCDPADVSGRAPSQKHGYGRAFPWHFDVLEKAYVLKAYVLEGSATLTADDEAAHGPPVTIKEKDMVTFPKGWRGRWEVHAFLRKRCAFFDAMGLRIDEDDEIHEEDEGVATPEDNNKAAADATAADSADAEAGVGVGADAGADEPVAEQQPCSVCEQASEEVSTCARCAAIVCTDCQVNDNAIAYCDRCREAICPDCGTVEHCTECCTGVCDDCGDVEDSVCDACRGDDE